MVAFILEELASWRKNRSRQTLSKLVYSIVLAGFITQMRPDLYFILLVAVFIWLGAQFGNRGTDDFEILKWIRNNQLSLSQVITGRIVANVLLTLVHLLILLPVAIFISLFWGITWSIICFIFLILIITTVTFAIFEILMRQLNWMEHFEGMMLCFIGLIITAAIRPLNVINPFCWMWRVTSKGINRDTYISLLLFIGFVIVMAVFTAIFLKKGLRKRHES